LEGNQKVLLSLGAIAPYKGLEYLVLSLTELRKQHNDLKLLIAGALKIIVAYHIGKIL
jgi:glycosyltransferase involved in cell wall biosynthesis